MELYLWKGNQVLNSKIETVDQLRELYGKPSDRARLKVLSKIDGHMKSFLSHSPFLILSSFGSDGSVDASPRGGSPGFVKALDESTLLIPDWPGNNRLDSITNIIQSKSVATLFLIPGVKESLRFNGTAEVRTDSDLLDHCVEGGKVPKIVIKLTIAEAFLHCSKAIMRSRLWESESQINRQQLATMNEMINDQVPAEHVVSETDEEMEKRYRDSLY